MVGAGLILLYALIGSIEGECYYFMQLLGQYRYCEEEYVGKEQDLNYVLLFGAFSVFSFGVALDRKGVAVIQYHEARESDEEKT